MYEVACEPQGNCDTDQQSFKAYLSRWMAASTKVAPFVSDLVSTYLQTSAQAAAKSCSGGSDGVTCGTKWTVQAWDNTYGVGQQMNALEVIQGLLIDQVPGPLSNKTGGISVGNPSAGSGGTTDPGTPTGEITTGDKAGAGILTAVILIGLLGGAWYVDDHVLTNCVLAGFMLTVLVFAGGWLLDMQARLAGWYSSIGYVYDHLQYAGTGVRYGEPHHHYE